MAANEQSRALMIYRNNRAMLEALEDAERGKLILALLDYLESGNLPPFTGALKLAFIVLRQDVDRSVERWEAECARRSAAGKKSAAIRAAKNFGEEVSCKNDCSTELNPVEDCSTDAANKNQNQNSNQNQNQNQNQSQNQNANQNQNASQKTTAPSGGLSAAGRERDFARFWQAYPRKVGKQAARKAFGRVEVPLDRLLEALERQRGDPQWQKENGRFIPHPVTWLNQGRWEDEPVSPVPQSGAYRVECL